MGKFRIEHFTTACEWVCCCFTNNGDEELFDTEADALFAMEEDGMSLEDAMRIVEVQS